MQSGDAVSLQNTFSDIFVYFYRGNSYIPITVSHKCPLFLFVYMNKDMKCHYIAQYEIKNITEYNGSATSTYNISRTLVGNKIVDNSDVVGESPVSAAPSISSFST